MTRQCRTFLCEQRSATFEPLPNEFTKDTIGLPELVEGVTIAIEQAAANRSMVKGILKVLCNYSHCQRGRHKFHTVGFSKSR